MIYCVSDIHGEYDLFCRLLESIRFSAADELYVLGDMTDKGPQTVKLCDFLRKESNIHCIAGNHEYDFLKKYHSAMKTEEVDFDKVLDILKQYFPGDGNKMSWEIIDWLERLPFFIEKENFICVHAGVALSKEGNILPLSETPVNEIVYSRRLTENDILPLESKCVIFGHTPVSNISGKNRILFYPRREDLQDSRKIKDYYKIHIDTGAYFTGIIGCLRIDDCKDIYFFEDNKFDKN